MPPPSIKGSAISGYVQELRSMIESGRVDRKEVELQLEAADLALLDEKIEPSLWYPIESTNRLVLLLASLEGQDPAAHSREMGRRAIRSILAQETMRRFITSAVARGEKSGPALVGLASLVYSFGDWKFVGDTIDDFTIEVSDAAALPDTSIWAVEGFIESLAEQVLQLRLAIEGERVDASRVRWVGKSL